MKNIFLIITVLILIILGVLVFWNTQKTPEKLEPPITINEEEAQKQKSIPEDTAKPKPQEEISKQEKMGAENTTSNLKTFNITGSNFKFSEQEIRVKKGDTVRIVFSNNQGYHDFVIDELNAKTSRITEGKTETIEFVADETGTFEYYCSVGNHRALGMKGKLIVE